MERGRQLELGQVVEDVSAAVVRVQILRDWVVRVSERVVCDRRRHQDLVVHLVEAVYIERQVRGSKTLVRFGVESSVP